METSVVFLYNNVQVADNYVQEFEALFDRHEVDLIVYKILLTDDHLVCADVQNSMISCSIIAETQLGNTKCNLSN